MFKNPTSLSIKELTLSFSVYVLALLAIFIQIGVPLFLLGFPYVITGASPIILPTFCQFIGTLVLAIGLMGPALLWGMVGLGTMNTLIFNIVLERKNVFLNTIIGLFLFLGIAFLITELTYPFLLPWVNSICPFYG